MPNMSEIPYTQWQPLSVSEVVALFSKAPFSWGLAGGYAIELFVGKSYRDHGDIDVIIFRDQQLELQNWLLNWHLYAADPPGTLRPWNKSEYLSQGIHDIWGHKHVQAWQLQVMLTDVDENQWFSKRGRFINGHRDDLIVLYQNIPCIRIEVQLLYKAAPSRHAKDDLDFKTCLPLLSAESKTWLLENLSSLYPQGHPWKQFL